MIKTITISDKSHKKLVECSKALNQRLGVTTEDLINGLYDELKKVNKV